MLPASLTAVGIFAHAVHLGLILLGFVGVLALIVPGYRQSRSQRRPATRSGRPSSPGDLTTHVD